MNSVISISAKNLPGQRYSPDPAQLMSERGSAINRALNTLTKRNKGVTRCMVSLIDNHLGVNKMRAESPSSNHPCLRGSRSPAIDQAETIRLADTVILVCEPTGDSTSTYGHSGSTTTDRQSRFEQPFCKPICKPICAAQTHRVGSQFQRLDGLSHDRNRRFQSNGL